MIIYLKTLFKQLSDDIKNYNEDIYNEIIGDTVKESEQIKKVCQFTLLKEYSELRSSILNNVMIFRYCLKESIIIMICLVLRQKFIHL